MLRLLFSARVRMRERDLQVLRQRDSMLRTCMMRLLRRSGNA